jgi:hypothetical protein
MLLAGQDFVICSRREQNSLRSKCHPRDSHRCDLAVVASPVVEDLPLARKARQPIQVSA